MNFFKPKYTVCKQCGVHFEPRNEDHRWASLCLAHKFDVERKCRQMDAALSWANDNWEQVYALLEKEREAQKAAFMPSPEMQRAAYYYGNAQSNNMNPAGL